MKPNDYERFAKMMLATAEAMDKDLTPQRILVYFDDLKHQDIRALEWAAQAHRRASNFFPKVKELKDLAQAWRPPVSQLGQGKEGKLLARGALVDARALGGVRHGIGLLGVKKEEAQELEPGGAAEEFLEWFSHTVKSVCLYSKQTPSRAQPARPCPPAGGGRQAVDKQKKKLSGVSPEAYFFRGDARPGLQKGLPFQTALGRQWLWA